MSRFVWTAEEFNRSEDRLLREAFAALSRGDSEERFRLLAIVGAKQRGGSRVSGGAGGTAPPGAKPTKPRWLGCFALESDGVYRIVPGSEANPP